MTKEQQIKIQRCIDEFYSNRPQVRDELGGALQVLYEAEPIKHGRWITVSDGYGNGVATASICECSLCKDTIWVYKNDERKWKYCPNCGARMDEPEAEP